MPFPMTKTLKAIAKRALLLTLLAYSGLVVPASAQEPDTAPAELPLPNQIIPDLPNSNTHPLSQIIDGNITPTSGCASCGSAPLGGGLGGMPRGAGGASLYDPVGCCPGSECGQGRNTCYGCEHDGFFARMLCGVYECLACPDPCYEPGWRPIMDVGFFTECARPVSQQRIRMTAYNHMTNYTRNSYKMSSTPPPSSNGIGPLPAVTMSGSTTSVAPSVNIYEASLYTEIAAGNVGIILDVPFLLTDFEGGLVNGSGGSGFGNMTTGIKSTIFDSELLQVGWKTVTNLPVGLTLVGLGNGLTSMEIGGLIGLKVSEDTYLQANLTEWIPFGGIMPFPGAMFITRLSLNHKVWQANPKIPVFMNLEYAGYFFQSGSYLPYVDFPSAPYYVLPVNSSGYSYHQLGPGIRMYMTEKLDAGFAAQFSLNPEQGSWGDQQYRIDFRFRY